MVKVLFVCMGNICRSPMAEGVFRRMLEGAGLVEQVYVDSAGTHSYHIGTPPDSRSQATALSRGVDLRDIRARRVAAADFVEFDYLLAMDRANYQDLLAACQDAELRSRIRLFMDFAPPCRAGSAGPYYGGPTGFERVMDLVEEGAQGLLLHLRERYRNLSGASQALVRQSGAVDQPRFFSSSIRRPVSDRCRRIPTVANRSIQWIAARSGWIPSVRCHRSRQRCYHDFTLDLDRNRVFLEGAVATGSRSGMEGQLR